MLAEGVGLVLKVTVSTDLAVWPGMDKHGDILILVVHTRCTMLRVHDEVIFSHG